MNPDNLDQKTDAELNELFAVEVEGRKLTSRYELNGGPTGIAFDHAKFWVENGKWVYVPPFCTDANAVLPWLEKGGWHAAHNKVEGASPYSVRIFGSPTHWSTYHAEVPAFARAGVIALLRAKRAAVHKAP